ncbi:MAG TPA: LuxR C-terminal-related transcriptional regulator [Gaiellaceae bacterium]|nr:LuxR C-terminal-related transcriptional regulator [Gaiellaceae bacterium]
MAPEPKQKSVAGERLLGLRPQREEAKGQLLLRSKMRVPRVPSRHVSRPRLLELLDSGREHSLTLVCAPPGYGKTALLAEWRERESPQRPFAWLTLDRDDLDPVRLWAHLIWAIRQTTAEVEGPRPVVAELYPNTLFDSVLPRLLETLADMPGERVIVLDDYHLADNELWDASLDFFLEYLPPNVQLVVASRSAPRLPLGRLRAHGELLEVEANDLRLDDREAGKVVRSILGRPLPAADIATLVERSEGWPAGVHLATLLLKHATDGRAVIESLAGDNRYVFDYLKNDLLDGLPDEVRTFLRQTSILSRLSAPLCDAVRGTTASRRLLEGAEHANLFLIPLDERREWYRYHRLFADVLRRDLEEAEPESVPVLHVRASEWFEQHGDVEESIAHAIAARDAARASDLVSRHAHALLRGGRIAALMPWLDDLSWGAALADPQLAVIRALATGELNSSTDVVESWLTIAESSSLDSPPASTMPSLEFGASLVRARFLLGGVARAVEAGRRASAAVSNGTEWRLEALFAHGQTLYLSGQGIEARKVLEQALLEAPDDAPQTTAEILAQLALIELDRGDLDRGEALARRSVALLEAGGLGEMVSAGAGHLALGVALGASGALAEAEAEIELGAKLREAPGPTVWHAHALVFLARARLARGDLEGARHSLSGAQLEVDGLPDVGIVASLLDDTKRRLEAGIRRPAHVGEALSDRELVILRLLAAGLTKPEIARELYIAYNTVKTHTRTIYRKLDASTREAAVARAREQKLI